VAVPVTLNRPAATTITATVTISDGSGIRGTDYLAPVAQTVSFAPGQVEQSVGVAAIPRATRGATRSVSVVLSGATGGAAVARPVGTILFGAP
jgi:hypothetical protein